MQYFGNLFALFFKLRQKQPSIQSRSHQVAPSEVTFLPVLWSHTDTRSCPLRWRTPSLKLPLPLSCWSIMSAVSEPWIGINTNPRELDLDYILGGATFLLAFDPTLILGLILQSKEFLHWSFHLLIIVEVLQVQELSHRSEQIIIWGSYKGRSKTSNLHPDFRFITHLSFLYGPHLTCIEIKTDLN